MENKRRKIEWKTVFLTVWQKKENAEDGKPERKFSLPGPQFTSSQIGRKIVERKLLSPWNYTNALSYLPSSQTQRLFWNQVKKKKNQRARAGEKKERMRALAGTFLNEGEKERKEGANKEIRTNVYGGKEKEKKERRRERKLEKKKR